MITDKAKNRFMLGIAAVACSAPIVAYFEGAMKSEPLAPYVVRFDEKENTVTFKDGQSAVGIRAFFDYGNQRYELERRPIGGISFNEQIFDLHEYVKNGNPFTLHGVDAAGNISSRDYSLVKGDGKIVEVNPERK
mgnify:CR=1 FL=1